MKSIPHYSDVATSSFLGKCMKYSRWIYLLCALTCFGSVAFAIYYLQDTLWLEPCPYCKLQRVVFIAMGIIFTLLAIFNPQGLLSKISGVLILLVGGLGVFIAGKHVYTQSHSSLQTSASCQSTSDSILEVLDFDVVRNILTAKGDCAVVDWTFLGLSIPMLSLLAYVFLSIIGVYIGFAKHSAR